MVDKPGWRNWQTQRTQNPFQDVRKPLKTLQLADNAGTGRNAFSAIHSLSIPCTATKTATERREDISWYGVGSTADLSADSRSVAFCLHGASQDDEDIYVMINAYWQPLQSQIQEGAPEDWARIVDTDLPSPRDFSEPGLPLQQSSYQVAPRSIVVLVRS